MKKQNILATSLLVSLMVGTTSAAMMDDMEKKMNKTQAEVMTITTDAGEKVEVKTMEMDKETKKVSGGMMKDMEEKGKAMDSEMKKMEEKGEGMMKDMEEKGEGMMKDMEEKGEGKMKKMEEKVMEAKKYAGKKAEKADDAMNKFENKLENKTQEEKLATYKAFEEKINKVMEKYQNSDISDDKKESFMKLFEYIKSVNEEKITNLENENS